MTKSAEKLDRNPDPGSTDPLVGCLILLAREHGLAASEATVTAGLPLEDGRLLPSQFDRAARRLGLRSRLIERPLDRLDRLMTPAVLLLRDERAELAATYTGYAILASPIYRYDARTPAARALAMEGLGYRALAVLPDPEDRYRCDRSPRPPCARSPDSEKRLVRCRR